MISAFFFISMSIISAFEYKNTNPESLFPFSCAANFNGSPVLSQNILSINSYEGFGLTFNTGRPYSDENLSTYFAGAKYSSENYGFQIHYSSFGSYFYKENSYSISTAYKFINIINTGLSYNKYQISIQTDDISLNKNFRDIDFAIALMPCNFFTLAFTQNSLLTEFNSKNKKEIFPEKSGGIILTPAKGFALTWNITDTSAGYINSFTASIIPLGNIVIKAGYTPEDSRIAASISIGIKNFTISYLLGFHPYLGYSHNFGITFVPFNYENKNYIEFRSPPESSINKDININKATFEELQKIPEVSTTSCKRIISYREKIGPLTEKSLIQIGLSREEINSIKKYCYGFERDQNHGQESLPESSQSKENKKKTAPKKNHISSKEIIKEKFRLLIEAGIPATSAIKYSELSLSKGHINFETALNSDKSLSEEQKETIRNICLK